MYAQGEQGQAAAEPQAAEGDNVQNVNEIKIFLLLIFRKPFLKERLFFL
jgi:hypothetical protein